MVCSAANSHLAMLVGTTANLDKICKVWPSIACLRRSEDMRQPADLPAAAEPSRGFAE